MENPINDDEKRWLRCPKLSSIVFTPNIISMLINSEFVTNLIYFMDVMRELWV